MQEAKRIVRESLAQLEQFVLDNPCTTGQQNARLAMVKSLVVSPLLFVDSLPCKLWKMLGEGLGC